VQMADERPPVLLTLGLIAAIGIELLVVQPYSVRSPWQPYVGPARRYLQAALAHDSAALERQSVSTAPVAWTLHAARMAPETLAVWGAVLRPSGGRRWGDTTDVVFETSTEVCEFRPIVIRFVGRAETPRVQMVTSSCFAAP
jgi:hypothetical protein